MVVRILPIDYARVNFGRRGEAWTQTLRVKAAGRNDYSMYSADD
jgi:hypothetical protein